MVRANSWTSSLHVVLPFLHPGRERGTGVWGEVLLIHCSNQPHQIRFQDGWSAEEELSESFTT